MRIFSTVLKLARDTRGVQSVELAMICAMIVIGLVASVKGLADENSGMWALVSSRTAEAVKP